MRKILVTGYKRKFGKNRGLISAPRRGVLVKRNYRFIDFKRIAYPKKAMMIIKSNIYDPNRSAKLTLVSNPKGILNCVIESEYTKTQKFIYNLKTPKMIKEKGSSNFLLNMALGTIIHCIEIIPAMGAKLIRAAGTSAVLLKLQNKLYGKALIKLKSGEHRLFMNNCIASIGVVGNHQHFLRDFEKAGTTRLLGERPRVRPSAMNPVDHPMGGRTKGGCAPKSHTGKLSHGPATGLRKPHNLILVTARKSRNLRISI